MITIEVDDSEVLGALNRMAQRGENLTPVLQQLGEALVESTKRRFATSTAPDGTRWQPNSPATVARYLHSRYGSRAFSKRHKGQLTKFGMTAVGAKRPLIGETKRLSSEIHYEATSTTLVIGSSLIYSAVQQFGAKKGAFGKTKRGSPIPWGNIPARPFLGLSESDRALVLDLVGAYLTG